MSSPYFDNNEPAGKIRSILRRFVDSQIVRKLGSGVFWTMCGSVAMQGLTFISFFFVARFLGKEGFGDFGVARATITMFAVFSIFGMGEATTRYIAANIAQGKNHAGRTLTFCTLIAVSSAMLFFLLAYFLLPLISGWGLFPTSLLPYVHWIALILFCTTIARFQTGVMASLQEFKCNAIVNTVVGLFSVVGLIAGAYWVGVAGALAGMAFSLIGGLVFSVWMIEKLKKKHALKYSFKNLEKEIPMIWKFAFPSALEASLSVPVLWVCYLMLTCRFNGKEEMAIYYAALQFYHLAMFAQSQVYGVLYPMLASYEEAKDTKRTTKLLALSFFINIFMGVALTVFLILFAPNLMGFFGEGYVQGAPVLILLGLAAVCLSISYTPSLWLGCLEKIWLRFTYAMIWGIVFLTVSWRLINKDFGALGLGWAYFLSNLIQAIVAVAVFLVVFHHRNSRPADGTRCRLKSLTVN